MQNADQREKATRSVVVNLGLALKSLLKHARALIVDAATRHINRLDLAGWQGFDRVKVTFANLKVVFYHLPEWP